jgi:acetyltransferase-like isoleucine patch superfamily enzyme
MLHRFLKFSAILTVGFLTRLAYYLWKIEGVNALLLVMPAKQIVSTLRRYGATIGEDVQIHSPLTIHNAGKNYSHLHIGDRSYLGRGIFLDLKEEIWIGNRVTVSMQVSLLTHLDVGQSPLKAKIPARQGPVRIEDGCYLGARVTVLQGVRMGKESAAGAAALLRENVADRTMVAGVPAKLIKRLD